MAALQQSDNCRCVRECANICFRSHGSSGYGRNAAHDSRARGLPAMDFETSRTLSMKIWAAGLNVRFFSVTIATETIDVRGSLTGSTFSDKSRPLNCTIELGSKVTKC